MCGLTRQAHQTSQRDQRMGRPFSFHVSTHVAIAILTESGTPFWKYPGGRLCNPPHPCRYGIRQDLNQQPAYGIMQNTQRLSGSTFRVDSIADDAHATTGGSSSCEEKKTGSDSRLEQRYKTLIESSDEDAPAESSQRRTST